MVWSGPTTRLVLDYGGVIAHHGDERNHADAPGVDPDAEPPPGRIACFAFRDGFVQTTPGSLDLLATPTGASREACHDHLGRTWLDPDVPDGRVATLREPAADHTLVCPSNTA